MLTSVPRNHGNANQNYDKLSFHKLLEWSFIRKNQIVTGHSVGKEVEKMDLCLVGGDETGAATMGHCMKSLKH